jgi:hypothetical protein
MADNTTASSPSCVEVYEYKDVVKGNVLRKDYEQKWRIDHQNKKKGSLLSLAITSAVWMTFSSTSHELLVLYSEKRPHLGHHTHTNSKFLKDQPFALRDTTPL